jgi:hypothetical protein
MQDKHGVRPRAAAGSLRFPAFGADTLFAVARIGRICFLSFTKQAGQRHMVMQKVAAARYNRGNFN